MKKKFIPAAFLFFISSAIFSATGPLSISIERKNDPDGTEKIQVTCSENAVCNVNFDYGDYVTNGFVEKKILLDFMQKNNMAKIKSTYDTKCSKKKSYISWAINSTNLNKEGHGCMGSGNVPDQIIALEGILVKIKGGDLVKKPPVPNP